MPLPARDRPHGALVGSGLACLQGAGHLLALARRMLVSAGSEDMTSLQVHKERAMLRPGVLGVLGGVLLS